eukprot:scaffold352906_cov48-Prasinocladus_malaysianus.AAC.1
MGTENLSLYEQWFKVADEDHDGKIAGAEAVSTAMMRHPSFAIHACYAPHNIHADMANCFCGGSGADQTTIQRSYAAGFFGTAKQWLDRPSSGAADHRWPRSPAPCAKDDRAGLP